MTTNADDERTDAPSLRFSGPEMDCPSCAQKVDRSLARVDGVTKTSLRPTTGTATVTDDDTRTSREEIASAIEGVGYEVLDEAGNDPPGGPGTDSASAKISTSWRAINTWIGRGTRSAS